MQREKKEEKNDPALLGMRWIKLNIMNQQRKRFQSLTYELNLPLKLIYWERIHFGMETYWNISCPNGVFSGGYRNLYMHYMPLCAGHVST